MAAYKLAVNHANKATELRLCRVNGSIQQNPHMRAFWASTISFFIAFLGWFALAPLGLDVAKSMKICENQIYPPALHPVRPAYIKFKNLKTEALYCVHGRNQEESPTDCNPVPAALQRRPACSFNATSDCATEREKLQYDPSVLAECICTAGTHCRNTIGDAGVASVASTIFVRVALGTLLERFGPVNVQTCLLAFGGCWVALAAAINSEWNYIAIRFFIGMSGATFVTNQFWCSLMFAPNIVGTANATAAGWGNLGGGVTQFFMTLVLFQPFTATGMSEDVAWRAAMLVPAVLYFLCAICIKLLCWDTPTHRRFDSVLDTGKSSGASVLDYLECLRDVRIVVMIFQYSACFGTELAMNNQLATHFRSYFQMNAADASLLASCFGGMNLFARSLGGMTSDLMFKYLGFRGRIWAQFMALLLEAIFLFGFGSISNEQPWYIALAVLVCFSLFVQMAEGTSYGIVPFMSKTQLSCVSALVGAGGNLGAVIAGFGFYRPIEDELTPFKVHAGYVLFWALLSPVFYWPEYGGMFSGPGSMAQADKGAASGGSGLASGSGTSSGSGFTSKGLATCKAPVDVTDAIAVDAAATARDLEKPVKLEDICERESPVGSCPQASPPMACSGLWACLGLGPVGALPKRPIRGVGVSLHTDTCGTWNAVVPVPGRKCWLL